MQIALALRALSFATSYPDQGGLPIARTYLHHFGQHAAGYLAHTFTNILCAGTTPTQVRISMQGPKHGSQRHYERHCAAYIGDKAKNHQETRRSVLQFYFALYTHILLMI